MKLKKYIYVILNANSIVHHVTLIKNGILADVKLNVKSIEDAKKIVVRILAHEFVTMVNVSQVLLISLFDEVINTRIS